jgi:hypothetical protein
MALKIETIGYHEKLNLFQSLVNDPEIEQFVKKLFDKTLAASTLNIVKRITAIEETVGLNNWSHFDTEVIQ